ncbi:TlpA family protein disulfide reductase [Amycolatopsis alkalitolerans]|uniref:TlpA family protein disulfide reductase n=1 Tax=Amycolatopsis alkalitolerans TaxID=2547244 RepID=A0A5C4LXR5_9PSEU|nr:TlpA disulfide reductase family protein [Amycolatopsis alkalitolerans]TNC22934.1 TlpA family protein disulfide reductase [Amycolatopsis alkalitolerans]
MTTATKWALAVGVLVIGVIIAVLPRDHGTPAKNTPGPDLSAARAAAALAPCPTGTGEVAQLKGVSAQCLGDGSTVDLGSALAGHTTLVNIWATWCEPCKTELPVLSRYAAEPGAAKVLEVQVASTEADGLALLTKLGVHLPSVFDGQGLSGPVRTALKPPPSLPASYLVTPDGQVRFIQNPRVFHNPDEVRKAVEGS